MVRDTKTVSLYLFLWSIFVAVHFVVLSIYAIFAGTPVVRAPPKIGITQPQETLVHRNATQAHVVCHCTCPRRVASQAKADRL